MELQSSTAERRLHNVKTLYNVCSKSSLKSLNKMLVSKYRAVVRAGATGAYAPAEIW